MTSVIDTIDPNWFYSSCAQSAAAIVGLMGAFITTKLANKKAFILQLKIEAKNHEQKIKEINDTLNGEYAMYPQQEMSLKAEMKSHQESLMDINATLVSSKDFSILVSNLGFLFIFSIIGVFIPLLMLSLDNETMLKYRTATFTAIFMGWLLIVINLFAETRKLMHNADNIDDLSG